MEFSALSNLQIFIIIVVVLSLIIFLLVSNRSKNIPTDAEAFNNALKALVNGEKDKAYHLLREIISKDSFYKIEKIESLEQGEFDLRF